MIYCRRKHCKKGESPTKVSNASPDEQQKSIKEGGDDSSKIVLAGDGKSKIDETEAVKKKVSFQVDNEKTDYDIENKSKTFE